MSHRIHAVYDGKVLLPESDPDLEPNARYLLVIQKADQNDEISEDTPYPLSVIGNLATDMKVIDLAEHHDAYDHNKLEDPQDLGG